MKKELRLEWCFVCLWLVRRYLVAEIMDLRDQIRSVRMYRQELMNASLAGTFDKAAFARTSLRLEKLRARLDSARVHAWADWSMYRALRRKFVVIPNPKSQNPPQLRAAA